MASGRDFGPDEGRADATPRNAGMTVYVDDAVHPWRGRLWAHLFSSDLDELHAFAARLGLSRSWFQRPPKASWPHYDVTDAKRAEAIGRGALPADRCTTL